MQKMKRSLAIFAALADEIRITRSKIQIDESVTVKPARLIKGQYLGESIFLVRTGIGVEAMHHAVSYCIEQFGPSICLNVGYCGATAPDTLTGDLVIANRVVDTANEERLNTSQGLIERAEAACQDNDMRYSVGGIATVHEVIGVPHEKAFIGTKFDVRAIDMESVAFVKACRESNIDHAVVRAVLDPMDMTVPQFKGAIDEEGETSIIGAIGSMIRRPKTILAVPRVEYCAVQAREAIAKFIDAWMGTHVEE